MKKIFLLMATLLFITGCSLTKDNLDGATIYTTVYPIRYLTQKLYGNYATIDSIYPAGADISSYELTDKQIKNYAKGDLFIYNGLSKEKNIAKDLINKNKNLLIIDVSYGLTYTNGIEELWMSPNNYLMLAKNIKDNLNEYLKSKYIIEEVNKNYDELAESLSLMDADLRAIGKDAILNGTNTIVVNDDVLKYLENYGFEVISLDSDSVSDSSIQSIKNNFEKEKYKVLIVLDNKLDDNVNDIINTYKITPLNISSMTDNANNGDDFINKMQIFIDNLRNVVAK